jgi:hypothetical protein
MKDTSSVPEKLMAAQVALDVGKEVLGRLDVEVKKQKKKDKQNLLLLKKERFHR